MVTDWLLTTTLSSMVPETKMVSPGEPASARA